MNIPREIFLNPTHFVHVTPRRSSARRSKNGKTRAGVLEVFSATPSLRIHGFYPWVASLHDEDGLGPHYFVQFSSESQAIAACRVFSEEWSISKLDDSSIPGLACAAREKGGNAATQGEGSKKTPGFHGLSPKPRREGRLSPQRGCQAKRSIDEVESAQSPPRKRQSLPTRHEPAVHELQEKLCSLEEVHQAQLESLTAQVQSLKRENAKLLKELGYTHPLSLHNSSPSLLSGIRTSSPTPTEEGEIPDDLSKVDDPPHDPADAAAKLQEEIALLRDQLKAEITRRELAERRYQMLEAQKKAQGESAKISMGMLKAREALKEVVAAALNARVTGI